MVRKIRPRYICLRLEKWFDLPFSCDDRKTRLRNNITPIVTYRVLSMCQAWFILIFTKILACGDYIMSTFQMRDINKEMKMVPPWYHLNLMV